MRKPLAHLTATLIAAVVCLAPSSVAAKGTLVRIEVKGSALSAPVEITDPAILGLFSIWTGPGVQVNDQPVHLDPANQSGMFIDWPKGQVDALPAGLELFEIGFDLGPWRPAYVVLYGMDRAASGYIYLPDHDDGFGEWNTTSIAHGVEGHWFHASRAWEQRVRPLVLARANEDEQAQH